MLNSSRLVQALEYVGADLASAGCTIEVLVVGGGSLLLLGYIERPTRDVDVIAVKKMGRFVRVEALPAELARSVGRVRELFELDPDWMNVAARSVMDHGLPEGYEGRLVTKVYGGLIVSMLGRLDLICLKLHAAVDTADPKGKHVQDLDRLDPSREEIVFAAKWSMTHDPSEGFRYLLCQALPRWGVNDADEWLPPGV